MTRPDSPAFNAPHRLLCRGKGWQAVFSCGLCGKEYAVCVPQADQPEQALTLAKAAAAHDSYAAAVLLAGYEKDKAAAAALLGDFRAVAAAGLRGCASTPLTADAARRALSLADAAIQRLAAQVNPKITLSVLAAKLG